MAKRFTELAQLEKLLRQCPENRVEIAGVIMDYLGRSSGSLADVFKMNTDIYEEFFPGHPTEEAKCLVRAQIETADDAGTLRNTCKDIFPLVCTALDEIEKESAVAQESDHVDSSFLAAPWRHLGCSPGAIIWHISDIHFGKYNVFENDPTELAAVLAKAVADFPDIRPDIVVVSGDVTSEAQEEEFGGFGEFCKSLSMHVWRKISPSRLLVVPGNHDTCWQKDGTADRMARFRQRVSDGGLCVTPFGSGVTKAEADDTTVRWIEGSERFPPFAVVSYERFHLEFILLVSGYYSGQVPAEVRELLLCHPNEDTLRNILRTDEGAVNREYILALSENLDETDFLRIAVGHHNPQHYGREPCANRLAPLLLETVYGKGGRVFLHGHTHLTEDVATKRPVVPGQAYAVPCPTLSSIPTSGSHGMMVHLVGPMNTRRRMASLVWELSTSSDFKSEHLRMRYSLRFNGDGIEVSHSGGFVPKPVGTEGE